MVIDHLKTTLISRYKAEIEEILVECEHVYRLTIDYDLLDSRLEELFSMARVDGLDEKIVWDLIHTHIPSYVNYINFKTSKKNPASKKVA